jgi:hypothetical protein
MNRKIVIIEMVRIKNLKLCRLSEIIAICVKAGQKKE